MRSAAAGGDVHDREHAFAEELARSRLEAVVLPQKHEVAAFLDGLLGLLFPQLSEEHAATADEVGARLALARRDLRDLVMPLVGGAPGRDGDRERAEAIATEFGRRLPALHEALHADAEAIVAGDPAAEGIDEVIAAYPGFLAIATHRVAHELHALGVPILPRLLAEIAHTRTGIDIHPGATIGRGFCIDHGTGVVVGETAVIGDGVKLYQGVTLGALSVEKSAAGTKRHPTVEDRVVVYAGATVLGGATVVGHDSIVGGNVFLTSSVPPHTIVYHSSQLKVRRAAEGFEEPDFII